MDQLTLYDYLSFVLPGSLIIGVGTYAYAGWPWHEPGASLLIILTAASFIVGYLLASVANLIEPMFLGQAPFTRPNGLWGTLEGPAWMTSEERGAYKAVLTSRYGADLPLSACYRQAATELRSRGMAAQLDLMNQHIGFARGMAVASAGAAVTILVCALVGHDHIDPIFWTLMAVAASALFIIRYRRFWRWYGEGVLRGARQLVAEEDHDAGG